MRDDITPPGTIHLAGINGDHWANEEQRTRLLEWAIARLGCWYGWNMDGPDRWDCGGFVCDGMRFVGLPDHRATWGSADLYRELEPVAPEEVRPMDMAFWTGKAPGSKVEHVMFVVGDGRLIGACGGGHKTLTVEDAKRDNAKVRFRESIHYREAFVGYRRLPIPKET